MATWTVNTNADDGSGSLRQAIANAAYGDTIIFDATLNNSVIYLSSKLPAKSVTIKANTGQNIAIDGGDQSLGLFQYNSLPSGYDKNEIIIDGLILQNLTWTNAGFSPITIITNIDISFKNCIISNNTGYFSGLVRIGSNVTASVVFENCLTYSNTGTTSTSTSLFSASTTGTTLAVALTGCTLIEPKSISGYKGTTYSYCISSQDAGFDIDSAGFIDATNNDYRLTAASPYLTGASLTGVDILGHPRKTNGAFGAYEGAWLVVSANGSTTINANLSVDYAEIGAGATVTFSGVDSILAVTTTAQVGSATFTAAANSSGFLVAPKLSDLSKATIGPNITVYDVNKFENRYKHRFLNWDNTNWTLPNWY